MRGMKIHNLFRLIAVLLFLFPAFPAFPGCSEAAPPTSESLRNIRKPVDYSNPHNWIILPGGKEECSADVFYVYPTVISQKDYPYMDWSDPAVGRKAGRIAVQQTGIFKGTANVYAPFYRQGEISRAIREANVKPEERRFMKPGIEDIRNAFRYYLKHYNKGKPFFLLGHSQGSVVLLELMRGEWKNPEIREKMVAAYLIGYPRLPKTFPEPYLKTARCEDDTGVIVTYNTESPDAGPSIFTGPGTYCINPLNWRTDSVPADSSRNLGAVFFDGGRRDGLVCGNFCGAVINPETGALIVIPERHGLFGSRHFDSGILHGYDLNFFYRNLTENAKVRLRAFRMNRK